MVAPLCCYRGRPTISSFVPMQPFCVSLAEVSLWPLGSGLGIVVTRPLFKGTLVSGFRLFAIVTL